MVRRIIAAVIAVLVFGWAIMAYTPQATLITGNVAGRQFENSDSAYLTAVYTMSIFNTVNVLLTLALLGVLALIWFKPVRDLIKQITTQVTVLFATTGALLAGTTDSKAFFDKTDKTEAYTILPNQSAFWIPDVGANLANQAQMDSEALYNANPGPVETLRRPAPEASGLCWEQHVLGLGLLRPGREAHYRRSDALLA